MTAKWTIEYDNNTGPDDGGFWEWWTVTNGEKSFKSDDENDAKWLAGVLNARDEERPNDELCCEGPAARPIGD